VATARDHHEWCESHAALPVRLSLVAPAEFVALAKEADPGLSLPGVRQGDIALVAGDFDGAAESGGHANSGPWTRGPRPGPVSAWR